MATATEPAWLAGAREAARARYESLPVPTNREEAWRFTNLRGFDPDAYEAHPGTLTIEGDPAGGVTFGSIARLVAERPELVEPHLGTVVSGDEKFAAGNAARWADGVFLHVPAGVHVEAPLRAALELTSEGSALYHRVLVVVERGARVTFTEEFLSSVPGYLNVVVELKVADDAPPRVRDDPESPRRDAPVRHASRHRRPRREPRLDRRGDGGTRAKSRMESYLADRGASVKVTGAYYLTGREHVDYDTTQEHAAPDTMSDLAFKGVLDERSRAVWRGVIRVDRGAQKTDAYQENRNLLLSPDAQATPIPGLEIEANDVRCTHGATVGQVDAQHLFYLMSRGLSKADAQRVIVRGFFEPVLERIASEPVRDALAAALDARIG